MALAGVIGGVLIWLFGYSITWATFGGILLAIIGLAISSNVGRLWHIKVIIIRPLNAFFDSYNKDNIFDFIRANGRIWLARFVVFCTIVGLSFIPHIGIFPDERGPSEPLRGTSPSIYIFWRFNRFFWLGLSPRFSGFADYPWLPITDWATHLVLTVIWWVFLSFAITWIGEYLLNRLRHRNNATVKP